MEVRGSIYHYPISPRAASQVAASLVEPSDGSLFRHPTPWIPHASSGFVCGFDECRFASAYKIYGILSTLNPLCSLVVWDSRSSFSVIQLVIWVLLVDFCRGYAAHVRTPTLPPILELLVILEFRGGGRERRDAGGQRGTRVHWTEHHKSLASRTRFRSSEFCRKPPLPQCHPIF